MSDLASLIRLNVGVASVSLGYCFYEAKNIKIVDLLGPSNPINLRVAAAAAAASSAFVGLSVLERTEPRALRLCSLGRDWCASCLIWLR
mmetsp:Transcript_16712/g.45540  ORF Transcript_16712/g.45540 Transcript_16712/m.45540 type:complete len:89 (-) Transcript_16712:174-440(-)